MKNKKLLIITVILTVIQIACYFSVAYWIYKAFNLNGYSFIPGQYMKMKNYQNLLSEEEFRDKTLRFEEDYKILCQKEKESDSTIFSILAQVRSNIC